MRHAAVGVPANTMRLSRDTSSEGGPECGKASASLKVIEFFGYSQRALYHEMKWQPTHMDVLAGKAAQGGSASAEPPVLCVMTASPAGPPALSRGVLASQAGQA